MLSFKKALFIKKRVKLNCRRFSYFRPFAHDIITHNTTHSNMCIFIGPFRKYVTWKVGGSRQRKHQKDIERRACSQKSDIPHTNFSTFFCNSNLSFLVSQVALIVLQRAAKRAHLRKSTPVYLK